MSMLPNNELSGQQSLDLIESMINRAKNHFSDNGHLYLLWGWVVFICSISQFVLYNIFHYEKFYFIWMATWLVVIYQVFYLRKKKRLRHVKTYSNHIINFVWLTFLITMLLIFFTIVREAHEQAYRYSNPVFLTLYGVPTFLTGIIIRFKPLIFGGVACWLLSVLSTFIPYDFQILLISAAMMIAWIIPGYLLKAKFNKQENA